MASRHRDHLAGYLADKRGNRSSNPKATQNRADVGAVGNAGNGPR